MGKHFTPDEEDVLSGKKTMPSKRTVKQPRNIDIVPANSYWPGG
jgi:hypothetical protein